MFGVVCSCIFNVLAVCGAVYSRPIGFVITHNYSLSQIIIA